MAGLGVLPLVDICICYVHFSVVPFSRYYMYLNKGIRMTPGPFSEHIFLYFVTFKKKFRAILSGFMYSFLAQFMKEAG